MDNKEIEDYIKNDNFGNMLLEVSLTVVAIMKLLINKNIINEKELEEIQRYVKNLLIEKTKLK